MSHHLGQRERAGTMVGVICFGVLLGMAGAAQAQDKQVSGPARAYRQWIDSTGRQRTEAALVGIAAGRMTLQKRSGEQIELPLERLSLADQRELALMACRAAKPALPEGTKEMPAKTQPQAPADIRTAADLDVLYIARDPGSPTLHGKVDYPDMVPQLNERGRQVRSFYLAAGTPVTFTGHVGNRGRAPSGPFRVQWLLDGQLQGAPIDLPSLEPGQDTVVTLRWSWADGRHTIALVADPDDRVVEITKANNVRLDPIQAAGLVITMMPDFYQAFSKNKNMLGSFSPEDWVQWHIDDMNQKFAQAVYSASPQGCHFRVRVDRLHAVRNAEEIGTKGRLYAEFTQGSWTLSGDYANQHSKPDWGLIHELAHQLGLIDLYQLNHHPGNTLLKRGDGTLWHTGYSYPTPETMMHWHGPHPFSEVDAAALNHQLQPNGQQSPRGWYGDYLLAMCRNYALRVLDRQGHPLPGAKVEMYQRTFEGVVPERPVGRGQTDANGLWPLPNRKSPRAQTHGGFTYRDNPWGTINVVGINGLAVFRIVAGEHEEVHWKNITEFNVPALRGQDTHTFEIRTMVGGAGAPQAPRHLAAKYLSAGEVRLVFTPSPTASVREYRVYCKDGRGSDGAAAFSRVLTMPASAAKSAAAESDHRPFRQPPPQRTEAIKLGSHMDGEWVVTAVDGAGRESTCSNAVRVPLIVLAHGLALAPDGTVFLSDAHPHTGMIVALPNGMAGPDWMFMPGAGGDGRMLGLAVHAKPSPAMPYRIVAVNTYAHLLHFFDPQGRYLKHVGDRAGSGPGQFSAPSGVAVGPDGRCYVTDTGNRRVQVFGPDGKFLGQFGVGDGGQAGDLGALQEPIGIALDTRGQVYVVDQKAGRVVVFRDGKPFRAFGAGDLQTPRWIALRNDGVVCVSQPSRREIAIFDAAGAKIGVYTGPDPEHPLGRVQGITFDRRGTLWIAAEDFGACLHRFEIPRRPGK